jgi:hypothetical protein
MKTFKRALFILTFLLLVKFTVAQPPIKIVNGRVSMDDRTYGFMPIKYKATIDSLDRLLKAHPNDTTGLFYRALFYSLSNNLMARPYQRENGALENLIKGKNLLEKAMSLGMSSLRIRVLRAQIYSDITYRFTGDESWMFNQKQITDRKAQYNKFRGLTNKLYDQLAQEDKNNAWVYQKLRVTGDYPIR